MPRVALSFGTRTPFKRVYDRNERTMRITRFRRVAASTLICVFAAFLTMPVAAAETEGARFAKLTQVRTEGGVVVTESPQASLAGLNILNNILKEGGNAVDAAVATVFAIGVSRPDNCGIGGDGFLLYRGADGATKALDFRSTAPSAMEPNSFNQAFEDDTTTNLPREGIHNEGSGHMVVGVPGVVAGMDEALKKLGSGKFPLKELIAPAEKLAREGIKVTWGLQLSMFFNDGFGQRFENYPETARIYAGQWLLHGPVVYRPLGLEDPTRFQQEDYAKSLKQIMDHGRDAFYQQVDYREGPIGTLIVQPSIGKLIVQDMNDAKEKAKINPVLMAKTNGNPNDIGLITAEDLSSYQPKWRTPITGHYRDHKVISMPPPAAGGVVTTEMLNLLENFKLSSYGHSSVDHLHLLAESQKLAWADRNAYIADPDSLYDYDGDGVAESVPTDVLTSKGYAQQRVSEIGDQAKSIADYGKGDLVKPQDKGRHTTHVSVIDRNGNAVAVTCSLNSQFGSSVVAPGTGFLLNNQLSDFDWTWEAGGPAPINAPAGGKRPRSSQSPTIVVKDGRPVLVTGGAGATSIINGVVQNILNVVDFDMDIFHAIDAPRIDAAAADAWWAASDGSEDKANCNSKLQLGTSYLALEAKDNRIAPSVEDQLQDRGHILCRVDASDGYANHPLIQSVGIDLSTGNRLAVSDPRAFAEDVFGVDALDFYDDQGPMGQ